MLRSSLAVLAALSLWACGNTSGPAVARTFSLYTVDRNFLPAATRGTDGRTMAIGVGRLQGTDLGPSCGMSLQLTTGPITSAEIPGCKLAADEEITFTATLTDSRFPSGPHEYRFVPP
ncbi:MAG TPA: hypothetical protein VM053_06225 [Gemmatimonadaceae bacterium]|nr:hypothetical protein [Gemmatimonadaceae bacterium]